MCMPRVVVSKLVAAALFTQHKYAVVGTRIQGGNNAGCCCATRSQVFVRSKYRPPLLVAAVVLPCAEGGDGECMQFGVHMWDLWGDPDDYIGVTDMHVCACCPCTFCCNSSVLAFLVWLLLLMCSGLGKALQEALEELKSVPPSPYHLCVTFPCSFRCSSSEDEPHFFVYIHFRSCLRTLSARRLPLNRPSPLRLHAVWRFSSSECCAEYQNIWEKCVLPYTYSYSLHVPIPGEMEMLGMRRSR